MPSSDLSKVLWRTPLVGAAAEICLIGILDGKQVARCIKRRMGGTYDMEVFVGRTTTTLSGNSLPRLKKLVPVVHRTLSNG